MIRIKPSYYGEHRLPLIIKTNNLRDKRHYNNDTIWDRKNHRVAVLNSHTEFSVHLWYPEIGKEIYLRSMDFQSLIGKRYLAW